MVFLLKLVLIMSQTTPCLQLEKMILLPVSVESHALAQKWQEDLWLLINQPGDRETQLLKITSSHRVEIIAALPILAASMTNCNQQMIVTGSNAEGRPLVIGLDAQGRLLWEYLFSGPEPTTWPVAACGPMPTIAWQQTPDKIEVGMLDMKSATLFRKPAITVGAPPAKIFSWKNKIWGVWAEKNGLHIVDLAEAIERVVLTDGIYANEFSIGQSSEGTYFGWTAGNQAYWLLPETSLPTSVVLENAAGGTFSLISGEAPLIWIQKSKEGLDGNLEWESTLVLQDTKPHILDGFVFIVSWWQQRVVVVNQSRILLLKIEF